MPDPIRELERYGYDLDLMAPPIEIDEIRTPAGDRPSDQSTRPWPAWGMAAAVATAILVVVGVSSVLLGGADGPDDTANITPTTVVTNTTDASVPADRPVFDPTSDTLCDWFTADEMNGLVAEAQEASGSVHEFEPFRTDDCWGAAANRNVYQYWGTARWRGEAAGPWGIMVHVGTRQDEHLRDIADASFVSHPALPESVTYAVERYGVGWDAGMTTFLRIEGHEDVLVFALGVQDPLGSGSAKYEGLALALARGMLDDMGWVDETSVRGLSVTDEPGVDDRDTDRVFDLTVDTLCSWFTAADMNAVVRTSLERAGSDYVFEPFGVADCWVSEGYVRWPDAWSATMVWGNEPWTGGQTGETTAGAISVIVGYPPADAPTEAADFSRHPLLDDSVAYAVVDYGAWEPGASVLLRVSDHPVIQFTLGVFDPWAVDTPEYLDLTVAIADELLRAMGWVEATEGSP